MIKVTSNADKFIQRIKDKAKLLEEEATKAAAREALRVQGEIREMWPVSTGESRQQIIVKETLTKEGPVFEIIANSPHAKYIDNIDPRVEFVRAPNSKLPPLDEIEKWARRQGILVGGENTDEADIVFLIARAIAKRGIRNAKIFITVIENNKTKIPRNITRDITGIFT